MAEDKIIKSGQFTLRRIVFLAASGLVLFFIIYFEFLRSAYLLLTGVLCVLLVLVAMDYGVNMEKVELGSAAGKPAAPIEAEMPDSVKQPSSSSEPKTRRKPGRTQKRRR